MPMTMTTYTFNPTHTQSSLIGDLNTMLTDVGWTHIDSYTSSSTQFRVYNRVFNSSTYGTAFLEVGVTNSLQVTARFGSDWNTTTDVMTHPVSLLNASTYSATNSISGVGIDGGDEFRAIFLRQGTTTSLICNLRPALNKPAFWDENLYCYWWFNSNFGNFSLTIPNASSLSPWTSRNAAFVSRTIRGTLPNGDVEIQTGVQIESTALGSAGLCGVCSNDIGQAGVPSNAVTFSDRLVVTAGVEEWLILQTGAGGLVVRVV